MERQVQKIQKLAEASIGVRPTRLAQMMGVSRCYLYRLIRQGRLPKPKRIASNVSLLLTADLVPALLGMGLISESAASEILASCASSSTNPAKQAEKPTDQRKASSSESAVSGDRQGACNTCRADGSKGQDLLVDGEEIVMQGRVPSPQEKKTVLKHEGSQRR